MTLLSLLGGELASSAFIARGATPSVTFSSVAYPAETTLNRRSVTTDPLSGFLLSRQTRTSFSRNSDERRTLSWRMLLEKLDATRQSQWQKLARLDASEIKCLRNLEYLGVPVCKREGASLSSNLSFGKGRRKKSAVRYVPSSTPVRAVSHCLSACLPVYLNA